jgi:hypothetical protein
MVWPLAAIRHAKIFENAEKAFWRWQTGVL